MAKHRRRRISKKERAYKPLHGAASAKIIDEVLSLEIESRSNVEKLIASLPPLSLRSAADILDAGAATFRDRNAQYGGNYRHMGQLIVALFPNGRIPPISNAEDANRLNLIIDCLGKLQRYAYSWPVGGHRDSAHDLMVYAAMLEEMTE